VLLLRPTVAALNAAGFRVTLLAPVPSGPALVGPGPAEAHDLVGWDRPEMAALFTDDPLPDGLRDLLGGHDLLLACTRTQRLVDRLSSINGTVIARDPQPPPGGPHAAEWLASSLAAAGIPPVVVPALLVATPEEEQAARPWREHLPAGFTAVHPGSGSPSKNWPAARFAELLDGWRGPFLVVEGPADGPAVDPLRSRTDVVVARGLPVRVLGALLAHASLYVGNDSGVTHLAAACGVPTLALFGPTDPALWSPVGPRARVLTAPAGDLARLQVEEVRSLANSLRETRV
jgi:ADP-heptose:LPS heptosyltransferase